MRLTHNNNLNCNKSILKREQIKIVAKKQYFSIFRTKKSHVYMYIDKLFGNIINVVQNLFIDTILGFSNVSLVVSQKKLYDSVHLMCAR